MPEVCLVSPRASLQKPSCNQPRAQRVRIFELVPPVLQVDGVDVRLDKAEHPGCRFSISHLFGLIVIITCNSPTEVIITTKVLRVVTRSSRMNRYANEEIAWLRLQDLQREAGRRQLT